MVVVYRQTIRKPPKIYLVYCSYPYTEDPKGTTEYMKRWARKILEKWNDLVLLIPHLVFDAIWDFPEGYTHEEISVWELALIARMDIFTYDPVRVSAGVRWEKAFAEKEGIPIITMEDLENGKRP